MIPGTWSPSLSFPWRCQSGSYYKRCYMGARSPAWALAYCPLWVTAATLVRCSPGKARGTGKGLITPSPTSARHGNSSLAHMLPTGTHSHARARMHARTRRTTLTIYSNNIYIRVTSGDAPVFRGQSESALQLEGFPWTGLYNYEMNSKM